MCAICAGTFFNTESRRRVDPVLNTVYSVMLLIRDMCKSRGAKTLVGRYAHNGKAIKEAYDKKRWAKAAPARDEHREHNHIV
jgi:hypothetical protein